MNAPIRPDYLELTLREEMAARSSTTTDARKRHEELAIAYEVLCLLGTDSSVASDDGPAQPGPDRLHEFTS